MIHWIQPYASDRNIGWAYNEQIKHIPDDVWIGITDQDFMFLLPDTKAKIERIVSRNEFDLYGCLTNRLGGTHQLYNGEFSDDSNIRNHIKIASEVQSQPDTVQETDINIAGCCMIFKKSTWSFVGGFEERSIIFDIQFGDAVKDAGGKLGIMTSIYGFHCYRLESDNPKYDSSHLWM